MVIELEPRTQQESTFEDPARHGRIADRAEQDGVVPTDLVEHRVREKLTGGVVAARTEVVLGLLDPGNDDIEHFECLVDDLWADSISGDDGELHGLLVLLRRLLGR